MSGVLSEQDNYSYKVFLELLFRETWKVILVMCTHVGSFPLVWWC